MKRLIAWFDTRLCQPKSSELSGTPRYPESAEPDDEDCTIDASLGAVVADWMNDHEPEQSVPMPDIFVDEYVQTVPNLTILDPILPDVDESTGIDPYNTAVLQQK
jgi:hypothetical protein